MSRFNATGWKVTDSKVIISNPWIRVEQKTMRNFQGIVVNDFITYAIRPFVQVVGALPTNELVLVTEDRMAGGWCVEAVGGAVEDDETPAEAALREFSEETSYQAKNVTHVGDVMHDSNRCFSLYQADACLKGSLFVAHGLEISPHHREPSEVINTLVVPFDKAYAAVIHQSKLEFPPYLPILSPATQNIILRLKLDPSLSKLLRE